MNSLKHKFLETLNRNTKSTLDAVKKEKIIKELKISERKFNSICKFLLENYEINIAEPGDSFKLTVPKGYESLREKKYTKINSKINFSVCGVIIGLISLMLTITGFIYNYKYTKKQFWYIQKPGIINRLEHKKDRFNDSINIYENPGSERIDGKRVRLPTSIKLKLFEDSVKICNDSLCFLSEQ